MTDKGHATATGLFLDDLASSPFCADKHHLVLIFREPLYRRQGVVKRGHGVLEVDNVDFIAGPKDILVHLGVPKTGLVPEVRAGLQQVTHTHLRHNRSLCLGYSSALSYDSNRNIGTRVRNVEEACYLPSWLSLRMSQRRALYHRTDNS